LQQIAVQHQDELQVLRRCELPNNRKTIQIDSERLSNVAIAHAAEIIRNGGLAVIPTDTVYGICQMITAKASPQRMFAIKGRDADKPIPILTDSQKSAFVLVKKPPEYAICLAEKFWPGPLTLVLPANQSMIPAAFLAADGSIALRVPDCAITLALIQALGAPLATSSANLQGKPPALDISSLDSTIAAAADLVIDSGRVIGSSASTIISCLTDVPVVLRDSAALPFTLIKSYLEQHLGKTVWEKLHSDDAHLSQQEVK
jgi:L-threonylcarbamoyladenylate synthase